VTTFALSFDEERTMNKRSLAFTFLGLVLATMLTAAPAMAQQTAKMSEDEVKDPGMGGRLVIGDFPREMSHEYLFGPIHSQ
jgi:hypothetical protein